MLSHSGRSPTLNAPVIEPLILLKDRLLSHQRFINEWFEKQWQLTPPAVYGSVDLRNAGFKLAPIDMNLFPAGFNNLNPAYFSRSVAAAKNIIQQIAPSVRNILLLPETHTRNRFYWENIKTLHQILKQAGFEVRFGLLADTHADQVIDLENGESIHLESLIRDQDRLFVKDFLPDLVLLNNDTSEGIPPILQHLKQIVVPPAALGWSQRSKSTYFKCYAELANEFSAHIDTDPWLITPLFRQCRNVDFMQQDGIDCLIQNGEVLFAEIKKKYVEYKINSEPFLIVKADAGTYGMAVMTIRDIKEFNSLNRKQRSRMSATKGGQAVSKVIIQEGVYTFETMGNHQAVAEPVIYLWGSEVVGGFYRVHGKRGIDENLNTPGMHFEPIAFDGNCYFSVYEIIAKLSMLAAAREIIANTNKDQV